MEEGKTKQTRLNNHRVIICVSGRDLYDSLRDCGISAIAIVGVAMEVGIEPTVRHAADLGYIPVVVTDACGAGHEEAAQRSIASLEFAGDALMTDVETICGIFRRIQAAG